jgi:hypothetical protein
MKKKNFCKLVFKAFYLFLMFSTLFSIQLMGRDYYATPDGAGNKDGTSRENAISGAAIENFIKINMRGGDRLLLDDNGGFFDDLHISISNAGKDEHNKIVIEGVEREDGYPLMKGKYSYFEIDPGAKEVGAPYNQHHHPGKSPDPQYKGENSYCFFLDTNVNYVTIKNIKIEHYDVALKMHANRHKAYPRKGISIEGLVIDSVYFGVYLADLRNAVIKNCSITHYIKNAVRLEMGCQHVEVLDCFMDHDRGDLSFPEDWAIGFNVDKGRNNKKQPYYDSLDQQYITFRNCRSRNNVDRDNPRYWNGDGFLVNGRHQNIRFYDCIAFGNADGGWDNKGKDVYFENCIAVHNGRNFRTWHSATFKNCLAANPSKYSKESPSGGNDNFWLNGKYGPDATIELYNVTSHNGKIGSSDHVVKIKKAENCIFSASCDASKIASGSNNIFTDSPGEPGYFAPSFNYDGQQHDAYNSEKYGPDKGYWYQDVK